MEIVVAHFCLKPASDMLMKNEIFSEKLLFLFLAFHPQ
jgi:hypothetical protein